MKHFRTMTHAAALCAALAVCAAGLFGCGSASSAPSGSAGSPAPSATAWPPSNSGETDMPFTSPMPEGCIESETTLAISMEGETEELPAIRHECRLGITVVYPVDTFTLTEEGDSLSLTGDTGREDRAAYLTVTLYRGRALDAVREDFEAEHSVSEFSDVTMGVGGYPATYLLGRTESETSGAAVGALSTEHYLVERGQDVYLIGLYYSSDEAEGYGAWLRAMAGAIEFPETAQS